MDGLQNARTLKGYMVLGQYGVHPHSGMHGDCCGLGALTAEQAVDTVFPVASIKGGAGHNQSVHDGLVRWVSAGQILNNSGQPAYVPGSGDCAAAGPQSGPNNLQLAQTASGLALTGTTIGLTAAGVVAASALAPFTLGISALIGLFPLLLGHHAQAVKKEQSVLCSAVPAANNYLLIIDQGVQSGKATPAQGIAALNSLVSDFTSSVSSVTQGSGPASSGTCNAACIQISGLKSIVAYKIAEYQDLAAAQSQQAAATKPPTSSAAPVSSVTSTGPTSAPVVSSGSVMVLPAASTPGAAPTPASSSFTSGLPSWWPIAAIAVVGIVLFRGL